MGQANSQVSSLARRLATHDFPTRTISGCNHSKARYLSSLGHHKTLGNTTEDEMRYLLSLMLLWSLMAPAYNCPEPVESAQSARVRVRRELKDKHWKDGADIKSISVAEHCDCKKQAERFAFEATGSREALDPQTETQKVVPASAKFCLGNGTGIREIIPRPRE